MIRIAAVFSRRNSIRLACASVSLSLIASAAAQSDVLVFSYFKNPDGVDGLHMAYSLDGYSWHAVNNDQGLLTPLSGSLMRDPSISRGADGTYHMVHTVSWGSTPNIGYAKSTDLVNWTDQRNLPVMAGYSNVSNVWAPEFYYDAPSNKHMILWASGVNGVGHRIYATATTDFNTFDPTYKFYDPGFEVIDTTIVKDGANHVMFVKDERQTGGHLYVYKAQGGASAYGPYDTTTFPRVSGNYAFEGPTATKIGDTWFVYGDRYGEGRMGLLTSSDEMQTWTDKVNQVTFPSGTKHGTVFTAPRSVVDNLIAQRPTSQIEFASAIGSSDLLTPGNWFGAAVPTAGKTPIIQAGNVGTLSASLPGTYNEFWIGQTSPGTLNMTGGTLNLSGWLCVGRNNGSAGSVFNQSGGRINTVNSSTGSVGSEAEGTYTLSNNASLVISSNFFLGERGRSTMNQRDNSVITVGGYMDIGKWGSATFSLQGGAITVSGDFNVADIRASNGTLSVSGGSLSASGIFVGSGAETGTGLARGQVMQTGGWVKTTGSGDRLMIGGRSTANGAGTYTISGGTLQAASSSIFVGTRGAGTFNQTGGNTIAAQWMTVGRYSGSNGTLIVSGGTLALTNATTRLFVGEQGAGTLIVSGSGSVDLAGGLRIAANYGGFVGSGTVQLNGGAISTPFIEDSTGTSTFCFNGGTLRARAASATFMQGLDNAIIEAGGAIVDTQTFAVTIAQSLQHDATLGTTRDGGLTKLGSGTLTLTGALTGSTAYTGHTTVTDGQLRYKPQGAGASFPIASAQAGDTIINGGEVVFDFTQGGSNPQAMILAALQASAPGGFQTGRLRTTNPVNPAMGLGWIAGASQVTVAYMYFGDANMDGTVTTTDFNTLAANFNQSNRAWSTGDYNYDGLVNALDFNALASNFGSILPSGSLAGSLEGGALGQVVPEPSSAAILVLASSLIANRRRPRR